MAEASPVRPRPLSPHALHWRWHVTMVTSILNRFTGVGLYAGLLIGVAGVLALASGEAAWAGFATLVGSWIGRIVLIGVSFSAFFHLFAGLRHLGWDSGKGFRPATANRTAWGAIILATFATVALWAYLLFGARATGAQ